MKKQQLFTRILIAALVLTTSTAPALASTTLGTVTTAPKTEIISKIRDNSSVETSVRNFFKDTPVMVEIARCESTFRQYTDKGNPLRSSGMIGVFQFYESIHTPGAQKLGFDLTTLDGNLNYAKHIYQAQGTTPWNGSKYCWEMAAPAPTTVSDDIRRTKLLEQITILTKLIALLQRQLDFQRLSSI